MTTPRKIIQIATTINKEDMPTIVGLCDDGTVWAMIPVRQAGWERLTPIPQDSDNAPVRDDLGKFD